MARRLLMSPCMQPLASRLLLASALVAASGATALAQPSATEPAPAPTAAPAPQNTDWNQVSHINGQLVPVGEKNEYFYQYKRTIISADPVAWIMGFYGVSASYGLDDHLALRGEIDYISPANTNDSVIEYDVGVPIYFRRTYQGAFLEPGFVVRTERQTYDDYYSGSGTNPQPVTHTETSTQYGPQVLMGWHWTWDSGLNVAAAIGVGRNLGYDRSSGSSSGEQYIPNGYLRFGYAF